MPLNTTASRCRKLHDRLGVVLKEPQPLDFGHYLHFVIDTELIASMLEEQLIKVAIGLALIIPIILLLRWFLGKSVGSPEELAEYHIQELKRRYANGEIDEESYQKRLEELKKP